MAEWLFGTCILILLSVISAQLRGLRKQLAAMQGQAGSVDAAAELSFAAWLEELESKGNEILSRLEKERPAVEQTMRQQGAAQAEHAYMSVPILGDAATVAEVGAAAAQEAPNLSEEESDQVLVRQWVRVPPTNTERGTQGVRTRSQRQNRTETQRKVHELLQRGVSVTAIAQKLGLSQGEVRLIVRKLTASQRAV
ncbi:MAG: DUF6115 domain-containing protein [Limnochordia bacterium]